MPAGLIERYRDRLPLEPDDPVVTLNEGSTPKTMHVTAKRLAEDGTVSFQVEFDAVVRIDTPGEADYYRNGGILQYVLRNMLAG